MLMTGRNIEGSIGGFCLTDYILLFCINVFSKRPSILFLFEIMQGYVMNGTKLSMFFLSSLLLGGLVCSICGPTHIAASQSSSSGSDSVQMHHFTRKYDALRRNLDQADRQDISPLFREEPSRNLQALNLSVSITNHKQKKDSFADDGKQPRQPMSAGHAPRKIYVGVSASNDPLHVSKPRAVAPPVASAPAANTNSSEWPVALASTVNTDGSVVLSVDFASTANTNGSVLPVASASIASSVLPVVPLSRFSVLSARLRQISGKILCLCNKHNVLRVARILVPAVAGGVLFSKYALPIIHAYRVHPVVSRTWFVRLWMMLRGWLPQVSR